MIYQRKHLVFTLEYFDDVILTRNDIKLQKSGLAVCGGKKTCVFLMTLAIKLFPPRLTTGCQLDFVKK